MLCDRIKEWKMEFAKSAKEDTVKFGSKSKRNSEPKSGTESVDAGIITTTSQNAPSFMPRTTNFLFLRIRLK
jgi:hypothetical protein